MRVVCTTAASFILFAAFSYVGVEAQVVPGGADAAHAHVEFSFDRKGLPVPKYQLSVNQDGSGIYQGEVVQRVTSSTTVSDVAPEQFRQQVAITSATTTRIFALTRQLDRFNKTCASKAKNIADTGTKVLSYTGPDGQGSCTYNYSENKDVQALTTIFQGIAETMDQGRELDHLHRYDRLGLDSAIKFLADEVSDGRALEIGTIGDSLRAIASDADVMERVRTRASTLLAQTTPQTSH